MKFFRLKWTPRKFESHLQPLLGSMLELGRQGRLKICWTVMSVWVRVPFELLIN